MVFAVRKIKNKSLFPLYIGMFCLMLFARDVIGVGIPLFLFLVYFSVPYCFFSYDECLALSAMLPLLNHGIQTNYIMLVACIMYIIRFRRSTKINKVHGIILLLCIYELLHAVIPEFALSEYTRYMFSFIYIGLVLGEYKIQSLLKDERFVLRSFVFMDAYFMLEVLLVTIKYLNFSALVSSGFRFGTLEDYVVDKPTLFDNENMVGLFAVVGIGILLLFLMDDEKKKIQNILLIIYFSFFGLLTTSKTFIICLVLMLTLFILYIYRLSFFKALGITVVTVVGVIFAINTVFLNEIQRVILRFHAADLSTGRNDLMKAYNTYIFADWKRVVFGIGLQNVVEKSGVHNSPHNATQELLLCWGIIGVVAILVLTLIVFKNIRCKFTKKPAIVYYIVPFVFVIYIQTIQFIRLPGVFGLVIILYASMLLGCREGAYKNAVN